MNIRLATTTAALALVAGALATPQEAQAQACLLDLDANGLLGLLLDGTGGAVGVGADASVACAFGSTAVVSRRSCARARSISP